MITNPESESRWAIRRRSSSYRGQLICPTGCSAVGLSSPVCKNISFCARPKSLHESSRPASHEGRFAIVTDVGCGMRWTQAARLTSALSCGRRSRVVLTPRRWRQVCGSDSAGDGGKKARSPRRARRKPLKPSACGNAGCSRCTRGGYTRVPPLFAHEATGAAGTRHSPRPRLGEWFWHSPGALASRSANARLQIGVRSLRGANGSRECAPEDRLLSRREVAKCGLLRSARNDGLICIENSY